MRKLDWSSKSNNTSHVTFRNSGSGCLDNTSLLLLEWEACLERTPMRLHNFGYMAILAFALLNHRFLMILRWVLCDLRGRGIAGLGRF